MKKLILSDDFLDSLKNRYEQAFNLNQRFIHLLIKAVNLCAPMANGLNILYHYISTGKDSNINIFNSTAKWCSNRRASMLHSLLLPINKKWGSIASTDNKGIQNYEEEITNKIFTLIDRSNLHAVANSFFLDLNIGCAALWINSPERGRITFQNIPGITLMPEYSDNPESCNVWFCRKISLYELKLINPEIAHRKNEEEDIFLTCGYLDMRDKNGVESWVYIQFLDTDFTQPISITKSPFRQLILVNETIRPGESRGYGIILQIMEEIEYLNDISQNFKDFVAYSSNPALVVPDQLPAPISELRGAVFPTSLAEDGKQVVNPVQWELDINTLFQTIKFQEEKIRSFFNVEPLGPVETPNMTATEASIRQRDAERQSTADLSRVANDTLGGIMKSVFEILRYWKMINVPENKQYEFIFDSPEVDIQARENINSIIQLSELVTQICGQGTASLFINPEGVFHYLTENLRTASSVSNTPAQINAIRQMLRQQMSQQQQPQQGQGQVQPQQGEQQPQQGEQQPGIISPQQPSSPNPVNPQQLEDIGQLGGLGF